MEIQAWNGVSPYESVEVLRAGSSWETVEPPFPGAAPNGRHAGPDHHLGIEHLVDCIQHGTSSHLTIEHATHVIEIIEKAAESARTGRTLVLETTFRS